MIEDYIAALKPQQIEAVRALLSERTQEAAAKKAGISTVTLWRWGKQPAFQAAFKACVQAKMDALLDDVRSRQLK